MVKIIEGAFQKLLMFIMVDNSNNVSYYSIVSILCGFSYYLDFFPLHRVEQLRVEIDIDFVPHKFFLQQHKVTANRGPYLLLHHKMTATKGSTAFTRIQDDPEFKTTPQYLDCIHGNV